MILQRNEETGELVYVLSGLDLITMFSAHMERGTGKPLADGRCEAKVMCGDTPVDQRPIIITVPPR